MLFNECRKEHKKVEELTVAVAQQQKGMEVLTTPVEEQAANPEGGAQLEMSEVATKAIMNKA
jgi:hypothetical protein